MVDLLKHLHLIRPYLTNDWNVPQKSRHFPFEESTNRYENLNWRPRREKRMKMKGKICFRLTIWSECECEIRRKIIRDRKCWLHDDLNSKRYIANWLGNDDSFIQMSRVVHVCISTAAGENFLFTVVDNLSYVCTLQWAIFTLCVQPNKRERGKIIISCSGLWMLAYLDRKVNRIHPSHSSSLIHFVGAVDSIQNTVCLLSHQILDFIAFAPFQLFPFYMRDFFLCEHQFYLKIMLYCEL